jgi:outer membrane protein assembly factor BamB
VLTYHGGPERTGIMPGPGPRTEPALGWETQAQGPFGQWSPAVAGGTAIVGDERGFVVALDETTGAERWQKDVGSPIHCGITVTEGLAIVGDDAGILHALDVATGVESWRFEAVGSVYGSAAVVDGVAYFGTTDGRLYALDVATRQVRWLAALMPGSISRAVAVADGIVYAGWGGKSPGDQGRLGAYDAATGRLVWSRDLDPGSTSTPTVADGIVFVASGLDASAGARRVFAFDARTGTRAWSTPFIAPSGRGTLLQSAVAGGRVYVTDTDGTLYVVDARTGVLVGEAPIASRLPPNAGIVGHTLYVTSDDQQVHAFDVSGPSPAELWHVPVTGTPGAPTVIDGAIFVGTNKGVVVKLSDADPSAPASTPPP